MREIWDDKDEMYFKMGDMHGEVPVKKPPKPTKPTPPKPPKDKPKQTPQKI